jgi:hypothetical protein
VAATTYSAIWKEPPKFAAQLNGAPVAPSRRKNPLKSN